MYIFRDGGNDTKTVFAIISYICFFLSTYFGILSQYLGVNELLKAQLLILTGTFFAGGTVIIASLAAVKISARLLPQKDACL